MRRLAVPSACVLVVLGVAGCGGSAAPRERPTYVDSLPPPEEPLVMTTGEVGTYGGRFVIAGTTPPDSFNPITAKTLYAMEVNERMFVHLVNYRLDTQEDAPGLASSWELSPDGLSCTLHLRHGAKFSDGHPITADDVLFTAAAISDPATTARDREMLRTDGAPMSFTAPDPYTVVVRSPRPNGSLLAMLDAIFVLPKHVLEPALKSGTLPSSYSVATPPAELVTSGAWKLKSYAGNEKIVLERNPYWFGVDAKGQRLPYLDELVFLMVPDLEAADLKFRAGEVDAIGVSLVKPANYQWYAEHQTENRFRLHDLGPELGVRYLVFNMNTPKAGPAQPPFKAAWLRNATFRRAVSLAIDRDAMVTSVLYGEGSKYWSYSTAGDKRWALPDVPHYDYQPEQARRLLASLGMVDRDGDGILEDASGHPVSISLKTTANNESRVAMANFVRDDLAQVGIKVTLAPQEFNSLIANLESDYQYDVILIGRIVRRPDPSFGGVFWRNLFRHWRKEGPASPEQAKAEQLISQIDSSPDAARRLGWWRDLHTIANEQAWVVWLPAQNLKAPIRDRFANVRPSSLIGGAVSILWNAAEIFGKPQARETH